MLAKFLLNHELIREAEWLGDHFSGDVCNWYQNCFLGIPYASFDSGGAFINWGICILNEESQILYFEISYEEAQEIINKVTNRY